MGIDVGDFVDAFIKVGDAIATGSIGLLAFSVALNIYLFFELRKSQSDRVNDLKLALEKADRQNAVNAASLEVLDKLGSKIGRRSM